MDSVQDHLTDDRFESDQTSKIQHKFNGEALSRSRQDQGTRSQAKQEENGVQKDSQMLSCDGDSSSSSSLPVSNMEGRERRGQKKVTWSSELITEIPSCEEKEETSTLVNLNPYVSTSPSPSTFNATKLTLGTVREVLGKLGKVVGEASKEAEDFAGNIWQHLKISPTVADAAFGRVVQGTKILSDGGYETVFRNTFNSIPEEQLKKTFVCYLSTSVGPVSGTLYVSTMKLAFCSDNPISHKEADQNEWNYYKVVIPLVQIKSMTPSVSKEYTTEKYIQVVSVDNHEFWFMAFSNFDGTLKSLRDALKSTKSDSNSKILLAP